MNCRWLSSTYQRNRSIFLRLALNLNANDNIFAEQDEKPKYPTLVASDTKKNRDKYKAGQEKQRKSFSLKKCYNSRKMRDGSYKTYNKTSII